ncbi:stage V sporulation protein AB [Peribacillus cavernae]|uniref:Stage V sporulation protein AB n=1 Tax=Peribacillus cavernae TaxID=1674310 RepID=A0A433HDY2_9BACI|nr:stage V sporulation protein AB [Peribacillus cavernae]RUQ26534.1 stage V sporulation protein AB [Peribacillus cavernae]
MTIKIIFTVFVGFAGGLAVGAGFVAFLTVLKVIPRLTQLTKTMKMIQHYEWAIVLGVITGAWLGLQNNILSLNKAFLVPIGLADGIFNGLLAAALTEVLNVFPLISKRIGIQEKIVYLIMAIVFGKIAGSLFQWIYFVDI